MYVDAGSVYESVPGAPSALGTAKSIIQRLDALSGVKVAACGPVQLIIWSYRHLSSYGVYVFQEHT